MKSILVDHGTRKELARIFKCTYPTIKSALNYKTTTDLSNKIRVAAIRKGGRVAEFTNQLKISEV